MKRFMKKFFTIVAVILLIVCAVNFVISISVRNLIYNIYNSNGKYSSMHIKDPAIVKRINVRNGIYNGQKYFSSKETKENYCIWFMPFVNLLSGKIHYTYSYQVYKNGDLISGSSQTPVTLSIKWEDLNWIIVDYYEPP